MSAMAWVRGETRLSAALVAAVALGLGLLIVTFLQNLLVMKTEGLSPVVQTGLVMFVLFGLLIAVAVAWAVAAKQTVAPVGASAGVMIGGGLAVGVSGVLICVLYSALAGTLVHQASVANWALVFTAIPMFLLQSAAEEIYFRGWIQSVLGRAFGPYIGIGVAAIAFAGLHGPGVVELELGLLATLVSLLNIALAGLLFGLLAWRTGGLMAPIAAHFGWNWLEGVGLGLFPNPGSDVWTAVADFDLTGSALWGGSAVGFNASLAVTFVLLAFCVPLALWQRPSVKPAHV